MSYDFNLLFQFMRCRGNTLIPPLILLGVFFGQARDVGTKQDAPIQFVSMFSADADVNGHRTPCQHARDIVHPTATSKDVSGLAEERPSMCDQVLNIVAGRISDAEKAKSAKPIESARVAVDSHLRVLITEPKTHTVHILDFAKRKYSRIEGENGDRMSFPYGIAVDAADNIYVTDLERGRIAVYNPDGKFKKYIGTFKGEGLFQNPRSIAIDRATGRIYLADTSRHFVIIMDSNGKILAQLGKRGGGEGPAEFKQPMDIAIYGGEVFVIDRQNVRIQVLDLDGNFRRQFNLGGAGASDSDGMAIDSRGRLFVPALNWVEVFDREGQLLFRFGHSGMQPGEFMTPIAVSTDSKDRLYVVDSGNHRIQVFQPTDRPKSNSKTEAAQ